MFLSLATVIALLAGPSIGDGLTVPLHADSNAGVTKLDSSEHVEEIILWGLRKQLNQSYAIWLPQLPVNSMSYKVMVPQPRKKRRTVIAPPQIYSPGFEIEVSDILIQSGTFGEGQSPGTIIRLVK